MEITTVYEVRRALESVPSVPITNVYRHDAEMDQASWIRLARSQRLVGTITLVEVSETGERVLARYERLVP